MENSNSSTKLVVGSLLAGALVGATLGVLFAPHKGKKTRKNIANSIRKSANKMQQELNEEGQFLKDKAMNLENRLEDKISKASSTFKERANELLHIGSDHETEKK